MIYTIQPIPGALGFYWFILETIEMIVAGLIVAAIYRPAVKKAQVAFTAHYNRKGRFSKSALIFVLCFFSPNFDKIHNGLHRLFHILHRDPLQFGVKIVPTGEDIWS